MRVVLRVEKRKKNSLSAMTNHNERLKVDSKILSLDNAHKNIRAYKKHENLNIDQAVRHEIDERVDSKKVRKDAVVALEIVISASPEYFRNGDQLGVGEYDQGKVDAWLDSNMSALKQKFGENLIQVDLHLDESTPHLHVVVVPIVEKTLNKRRTNAEKARGEKAETYVATRLDAKALTSFKGEYDFRDLQQYFAEAVEHLGINRGLEGSRATHQKLKKIGQLLSEVDEEHTPSATKMKPLKRLMVTVKNGFGFSSKQQPEDDASYYKRCYEKVSKWAEQKIKGLNNEVLELKQALKIITNQLEQEKKRGQIYSAVNGNPELLLEIQNSLEDKEKRLEKREENAILSENEKEEWIENATNKVRFEMSEKLENLEAENSQIKAQYKKKFGELELELGSRGLP